LCILFRFAGYFPSVVGLFNLLLFTIQIRVWLSKPNAADDFSGFLPKAATRFGAGAIASSHLSIYKPRP
jgi:hypothetical protein